jgi:antitoxin component YwqK of YwqJK toxin-antitoxin module
MKSNLHLALLFLIPFLSSSQTPVSKIVYFDSLWKESTEDNYDYYRIIKDYYSKPDNDLYSIFDYYKSGVLQMEGTSTDKDALIQEGQFAYYYENGNKKTISKFINCRLSGKQFNWYEDGKPKSEIEYLENQEEVSSDSKINQYWNAENIQTVIDGNGYYEYLEKGFFESGKVKNGFHEGKWKGGSKKPNYTFVENYENGKLISGTSIDSSNIEYGYKEVHQRPVAKQGMNHFYSYIGRRMRIPYEAQNTVFGTIHLTFVIDTDGGLTEIKIIKGLSHAVNNEAIRVLKNYKEWSPGSIRGIPVGVIYSLPITLGK